VRPIRDASRPCRETLIGERVPTGADLTIVESHRRSTQHRRRLGSCRSGYATSFSRCLVNPCCGGQDTAAGFPALVEVCRKCTLR
jgi:hypothetical protein